MATNAAAKNTLSSTEYTPIAMPTCASNDLPTAVMLATDSALWPIARVSSTSTKRAVTPPVRRAHAPDDEREHERQRRRRPAQADAIEHAADRQADRRADERRPQVDVGVGDAIEMQVASSGSVMSPRPCVRPGSVASMTTAATTTLTQPKRIVPVSVVQRRLAVGGVEDGVEDIGYC